MSGLGRNIWFSAALTFACSWPGYALENLNWSSSVQEVTRNNAELQAVLASQRAAEQTLRGSRSNYYPQVGSSLGYSYGGNLETRRSLLAGDKGDSSASVSASISVSQNLFAGWADQARVDQAKAGLEDLRAQVRAVKARISRDLKTAYASMIYAQRAAEMQEDIYKRRQDNLRLVTLRFESGAENKGSVLLSQAYLEQARFDALQARHTIQLAQAQLAQVLGRDQPGDLRVQGEVPSAQPPPQPDFMLLARQTPAHGQSESQVASAQASVVVARAAYFPSLSFSGNLGRTGEEWFPDREGWTLGLSLNYPLFSGGRDRAASYAAASNLLAAEATRRQVDRSQLTQLQDAYNGWIEAIERVKVETSFLEAAKLRAEIARNKYNNGLLDFEAWDLIESELISRQRTILQSQRDRVVAESAWEQTQGKGVIP